MRDIPQEVKLRLEDLADGACVRNLQYRFIDSNVYTAGTTGSITVQKDDIMVVSTPAYPEAILTFLARVDTIQVSPTKLEMESKNSLFVACIGATDISTT